MAKKCDICKRKSTRGALRSHSNIKTLRRLNLNLQKRIIDGRKVKVCARCLKTIKKK